MRRIWTKFLGLLFLIPILSSTTWAAVDSDRLNFQYMSAEGETTVDCVHFVQNAEAGDWDVFCKDPQSGFKRSYGVHLRVKAYPKPALAQISYEVLYWVTDRTDARTRRHVGTTLWFHMAEDPASGSRLQRLELAQQVENGQGDLRLSLRP